MEHRSFSFYSINLNLAQVIFVSFTSCLCVFPVREGKGGFVKEVLDLLCAGVVKSKCEQRNLTWISSLDCVVLNET